jgi:hypothetical protein
MNYRCDLTLGLEAASDSRARKSARELSMGVSNTLEVIDFWGLFSGNAIGPARQYTLRLVTSF